MRPRTARVLLGLVGVLIVAGMGWWYLHALLGPPVPAAVSAPQAGTLGNAPAHPAAPAERQPPPASHPPDTATAAPDAAAPASVPLPAEDLPLVLVIEQLEARARAGEAAAALHLYRALHRCTPRNAPAQERVALQCLQRLLCGEVRLDTRWDWLVQAASAGHPEAQALLLNGRWLEQVPMARRHAFTRLYHEQALLWAMTLARRGHASALAELATANASPDALIEIPLGLRVAHDRVQAAAYAQLARLARGDAPQDLSRTFENLGLGAPTSAEVRAVDAWVQRWRAQHPVDPAMAQVSSLASTWDIEDVRRQAPQCLQEAAR